MGKKKSDQGASSSKASKGKAVIDDEPREIKFYDSHNQLCVLTDPDDSKMQYKSLYVGLRECRLEFLMSHQILVDKVMVKEFWETTSIQPKKGDQEEHILGVIKHKEVRVSESILRSWD